MEVRWTRLLYTLVLLCATSRTTAGLSFGQRRAAQLPLSSPSNNQPVLQEDNDWNALPVRRKLESALEVMQAHFFETWIGQWPTSIDWTGAVLGTHLSATADVLARFARSHTGMSSNGSNVACARLLEDQINGYFAQLQAYYFGEDAFAIRLQAHDDMLWVVLGWLEAVKFIEAHDARRHARSTAHGLPQGSHWHGLPQGSHWHGKLFASAFAHRSHVFYDIVSRAWDESICGGGLTWNPNLEPYKNAVTNEQFISAAIGMYLYHPGDSNTAPFIDRTDPLRIKPRTNDDQGVGLPPSQPHDTAYLSMAQMAYRWLTHMNMTNDQGLYVDGFHIRSYWDPSQGKRIYGACDLRDETVYTYNQGVILSGQRQLWEATGQLPYLQDGHTLVRSVIAATGWPRTSGIGWRGLGYDGILHDFCDPRGYCSQDAQTFKGIFFHHLAAFCEPLPVQGEDYPLLPGKTYLADKGTAALHANSCRSYTAWVEHNAKAAWGTRNRRGVMGAWWAAPRLSLKSDDKDMDKQLEDLDIPLPVLPEGAADYRNAGNDSGITNHQRHTDGWDFNDRGRGRTVESHSGGLAVLRALYALEKHYDVP